MNDYLTSAELQQFQMDPVYEEGMTHLGAERWQQAYVSFQQLQEMYPDVVEVKELLSDVQMRAALTQIQPGQTEKWSKRSTIRRLMAGSFVIVLIITVAFVAYEFWIDPVILQEFRVRNLVKLRSEADEAMEAGDYGQARQALEQLQAILPEDSETLAELHRIEQVEKSSALYDQAKFLMAANDWDQAVKLLAQLHGLDPHYRDLPQLLQVAQESQVMNKQFQAAERAFERDDWQTAISRYEALRRSELTFRFEDIQGRLFESHLKSGQVLLNQSNNGPNEVAEALTHFSEALKHRPVDPEALNERRLAEVYRAALKSTDRTEVIDLLQIIYEQQPNYAGREAAQLLYARLLERAALYLAVGNKAAALDDYQAAARLAVEDTSEATQKLAELTSETVSQ